ncbi:MAG: hypothetical protein ACE367_25335 [Acidimicrobiales bacterium]
MFSRLRKIEDLLTRIDTALVVRDPGSARSAEAYEGLRKQVAMAARSRREHLAQLVEMSDAIDRGATVDTLRERVDEWTMQAGLTRLTTVDPIDHFEIEGSGEVVEVVEPAWIDSESGALIRSGRARRRPAAPTSELSETNTQDDENKAEVEQ